VKHTINETEFFGGKTFDAMSAEINSLPTPSTEEIKRKLAERIYEI